jgi:hypothetical protein
MQVQKTYLKKTIVIAMILVMVLVALGITGCAKGTKLAGRTEALQAMKAAGFKFDSNIISTEYGTSAAVMIVTGPMIGPKVLGGEIPPKNGETYTQYSRVMMKLAEKKWVIAETTLR